MLLCRPGLKDWAAACVRSNNMTRKNVIKMIFASLIFIIIFGILTAVLEPKWNYYGNQTQTRVQAFYRQEKGSHDVIYLGSSFSYCGISPLKIWEEQKISGYVFSNPAQKAWISAYYLEEALKYQTPEVVVYEAGAILDEEETDEGHNRKNIDYLRWSPTKLKAIMTVCANTGESKKEYLFPLLRFHSRWSDLDQADFHLAWDSSYYLMGTALKLTTRPASKKNIARYHAWQPGTMETPRTEVGPKCKDAVLKMKKLCQEKGIKFQLVRMPSMQWSPEAGEIVQRFADENQIPFLDMNLYREEIGVDWRADTHDKGMHLNILGCEKASSFLGKYLKENYEFETKMSDDNRKFWDTSAMKFNSLVESYTLPVIGDCEAYVGALDNEDFITAVTLCAAPGNDLTGEQRKAFSELGLNVPAADAGKGTAYLALLDGRKVVREKSGEGMVKSKPYTWGEDTFRIVSGDPVHSEQTLVAVSEREYEVSKPGINIVVYDKTLGQVVDVVNFDTAQKNAPAEHVKQPLIEDDGGE